MFAHLYLSMDGGNRPHAQRAGVRRSHTLAAMALTAKASIVRPRNLIKISLGRSILTPLANHHRQLFVFSQRLPLEIKTEITRRPLLELRTRDTTSVASPGSKETRGEIILALSAFAVMALRICQWR